MKGESDPNREDDPGYIVRVVRQVVRVSPSRDLARRKRLQRPAALIRVHMNQILQDV